MIPALLARQAAVTGVDGATGMISTVNASVVQRTRERQHNALIGAHESAAIHTLLQLASIAVRLRSSSVQNSNVPHLCSVTQHADELC